MNSCASASIKWDRHQHAEAQGGAVLRDRFIQVAFRSERNPPRTERLSASSGLKCRAMTLVARSVKIPH